MGHDGWTCRYQQFKDGRRQIISILLHSNLGDACFNVLRKMDRSIGAVTLGFLTEIPRDPKGGSVRSESLTPRHGHFPHGLEEAD